MRRFVTPFLAWPVRLLGPVLLGLTLFAATPSASAVSAPMTGTISGTVTNANTLAAVSGVTVSIYSPGATLIGSTTTDASGGYTVGGLAPGSYFVRAIPTVASGLVGLQNNNVPCPAGTCPFTSGNAVTVVDLNSTTVNFALPPGARITGTVTNATTLAVVSGVSVSVLTLSGSTISTVTTNGSGVYTSLGLPTGSYLVRALPTVASGLVGQAHNNVTCLLGSCPVTSGAAVAVTTPNSTNINFALQPGATITGTITNAVTLAPVASVSVAIFTPGGPNIWTVTTNGSGVFTTPGLTTGSYLLRALPPVAAGLTGMMHNSLPCPGGACTVTAGTPIAVNSPGATNVNFALPPGGTITGTVTNATTLAAVSGATMNFFTNTGTVIGTATTTGAGTYTSPPLPTGSYVVRADTTVASALLGELYNNIPCLLTECTEASGSPVSVTAPGATNNINLALTPGATISGTITSTASGLPVNAVTVSFYSSVGTLITTATTNASGVYGSPGLPSGQYFVRAVPPLSSGLIAEHHNDTACPGGSCATMTGTPVVLTAPNATPINFALSPGATISGTVTNATTLAPVAGASVSFFQSNGTLVLTTATDGLGQYASPGLTSGSYFVRANPPASTGLVGQLHSGLPCPVAVCTVTSGTPVPVTSPSPAVINFALQPGATITGTLTNETTLAPVGGATVRFYSSTSSALGTFTTDASGYYTSAGLPTGSYFVRAEPLVASALVWEMFDNVTCQNATCAISSGTPVAVTSPNPTAANIALQPGATITGTVTNAITLAPVPGVGVSVYTAAGTLLGTGTTDALGNYTSPALATGSYYVRAIPLNTAGLIAEQYNDVPCPGNTCPIAGGTTVAVTAGNATIRNFALTPGATITGTVTNAATLEPVGGATVGIYSNNGTFLNAVSTNALGVYTSLGLPSGPHFVLVEPTAASGLVSQLYGNINCPAGDCTITNGTPVIVAPPAQSTGIDFQLIPGGTLAGIVTNATTSAPVSGASVVVHSSTGVVVTTVTTDAQGNYKTAALPGGSYFTLALPTNSSGLIGEAYNDVPCLNGNCTATTGTPVVVVPATELPINFALTPGAKFTGTVTNASTLAAVSGATIAFFTTTGDSVGSVTTNASGAYTSPGLPAGPYLVRAMPTTASGLVGEMYGNVSCPVSTCAVTIGTAVVLAPGGTPGIDFALDPGATISGTVTSANGGAPVQSVSVTVYLSNGTSLGAVTTNALGVYTSAGLPTGSYFVRALPPLATGLAGELYNNLPCPGGFCVVTSGLAVAVTAPTPTQNINFALDAGGRITGTVRDAVTLAPIPGIAVQVFSPNAITVTNTTTDSNGVYISAGLATGTYFVRAVPAQSFGLLAKVHDNVECPLGTCSATVTGTPVVVTAPGLTQIDFALVKGATVTGRVTEASSGLPLGDVTVSIFTDSGVFGTSVTTDSQGYYVSPVLGGVGGGFVRATPPALSSAIGQLHSGVPCPFGSCPVTSGTPVPLTPPASTVIDFALDSGATITGTITDAVGFGPVAGATVQFFRNSGTNIGTATSNAFGVYTSPGLPTDSYFIRVTPPDGSTLVGEVYQNGPCPGGTCSATSGSLVPVTSPSATVINFALDPGATLTGTVTAASSGAPVPEATVLFLTASGVSVGSVTTDAQGIYLSPGLPTGSYRIRVTPPAALGLVGQIYNGVPCPGGSCHQLSGSTVAVTAPNATNVNFSLGSGATIMGTVTNATTLAPVSNVSVVILSDTGSTIATVTTDAAGVYQSTGLPTGSYFVRASPAATSGLVGEVHNGLNCPSAVCTVTKGTAVAVTSPNATIIDFALEPGASIRGKVIRGATLVPEPGVSVAIFTELDELLATVTTTGLGTYITPAFPTGSYFVRALPAATSGLIGRLYNNLPCPGGSCVATSGTPVALTAPTPTLDIDFALDEGATIQGTVTRASNGALLGAVSVEFFTSAGESAGSVSTDVQGFYSSSGLAPGTYFVVATPPVALGLMGQLHNGLPCAGGNCLVTAGAPVAVAGDVTSTVNFALTAGAKITGTVTRSGTGDLVGSVTMRFYGSDGTLLGTATTNPQGVFESPSLPTGSYFVQAVPSTASGFVAQAYNNVPCPAGNCPANTGTAVAVTSPNTTPNINFALASVAAATNNSHASAVVIGSVPYQSTTNINGATAGGEDPAVTCGSGSGALSVWYVFTPGFSGPVGFNTFGSEYDTILSIYTGSPGSFSLKGCNDDTDGPQSSLTVQAVSGQQLSILVTSHSGDGILVLNGATVPGAPTGAGAISGNSSAIVSFSPPASNGGAEITGYIVTAQPGGATANGVFSPIGIGGLTNGVPYTFTVAATNSVGTGPSSGATGAVTPNNVVMTRNPAALRFGATKAGAAGAITNVTGPQPVSITFSSGAPAWTLSVDQPWVQLSATGGTGAGQFTVGIMNPGNVIGSATSLSATITVIAPGISNTPQTIGVTLTVDQNNTVSTAAFGQVDTPAQNADEVQGAIAVTGWTLDNIGVAGVKLYRNCLAFENQASCQIVLGNNVVFIADAAFLAGARPDVEAAFTTLPESNRAGWGYLLLTSMLPHVPAMQLFGGQGPLTLYAVATDIEGNQTMLGRSADPGSPSYTTPTAITMTNDAIAKPFGAIDTPGQGQTISGVFFNFGWALTPDSDTTSGDPGDILIAKNGSTMTVFIDGLPTALVAYNQCRGSVGNPVPVGVFCNDDVANIFGNPTPQPSLTTRTSNPTKFRNLDAASAAIGAFGFDTATLGNGMHTIAWSVTDSMGRIEGIGSRFFNVLNSGADQAPLAATPLSAAMVTRSATTLGAYAPRTDGVWQRQGFDLSAAWQSMKPREDGTYSVQLKALGRLELWLGGPVDAGYHVANHVLHSLPVGSSLKESVFAWTPPAGYVGPYELVFLRGDERITVTVTVVGK